MTGGKEWWQTQTSRESAFHVFIRSLSGFVKCHAKILTRQEVKMHLLKAEVLVLMATFLDYVQSHVNVFGEHVCMETETYYEPITVVKKRPKEIKRPYRCWSITKFFSCEETIVLWVDYNHIKNIKRSRVVARCCRGYVELGSICVPQCSAGCINGKCVAPGSCACDPGFHGFTCLRECSEGYWGAGCVNECKCSNSGKCDRKLGCICQPGWTGDRCQLPCQEGYYGHLCENKCTCNSDTCNHITGECFVTTAAPTTTADPLLKYPLDTSFSDYTEETLPTSSSSYAPAEWSTTQSQTSMSGIFKIPPDIPIEIETSTAEDETTTEIDATGSEMVVNKITVSEVDDFESEEKSGEISSTESASTVTKIETFGDGSTTVKTTSKEVETEIKINLVENEIHFQGSLGSTSNAEREATSSTVFPATPNAPGIVKNRTNWIRFTARTPEVQNETGNFIIEGKGSSSQESVIGFLYFLPSLSVLSAVSLLIVIIAGRWIFVSHKRKTRMLLVVAEKGSIFQSEEQVKFQRENILWVNNCTVNPVYMSDVEIDNKVPVLETFKPVDKGVSQKEMTVL